MCQKYSIDHWKKLIPNIHKYRDGGTATSNPLLTNNPVIVEAKTILIRTWLKRANSVIGELTLHITCSTSLSNTNWVSSEVIRTATHTVMSMTPLVRLFALLWCLFTICVYIVYVLKSHLHCIVRPNCCLITCYVLF